MADRSGGGLAVDRQAGQDGEPGGVGRGPARRAQLVRAQVEDGARAGAPPRPAVVRIGGEELVVGARRAVDDDHVAVATRAWAALDRGVARQGIAVAVGLRGVLEADGDAPGAAGDDGVRDAVGGAGVDGAEVGVDGAVEADAGDQRGGVRGHGEPVHPLVPRVVGREDGAVGAGQSLGRARGGRRLRLCQGDRRRGDAEDGGEGPAEHLLPYDTTRMPRGTHVKTASCTSPM